MVNSTLVVTLYVNPVTGNDTNAGSRLSPFKSLSCALKVAKEPAIIQLASGTYSSASGEVFPLVIPSGLLVVGNEANKGQGVVISGSGEYQSPSIGLQNITMLLLGDASLLGVTVTNSAAKGTGIWIESTAPTLANNTLTKCGREGIFTTGTAKPAILDNLFVQNVASGLFMARNSKGEVLGNIFQNNPLGIAISDFAAPLIANNRLSANSTAIAISRNAKPVLRRNLITKNSQCGLLVNGDAVPNLGHPQDPAGNIFLEQGELDLQNLSSQPLISVGNQLNPSQTKGLVEFVAARADSSSPATINTKFSDLDGHWAAAFVSALVDRGLMSGFPDGTFQPATPMTRAQYAAVIAKSFQLTSSSKIRGFTDVKSDFWAASAIFSAAEAGFVSGFPDGSFRPGQNLTRVQALVSLVNGLKITGGNPNVLTVFSDRAQIPSYATNVVATATQKLLVVNYPQIDLLEPLREITRGEVAALIYQALVSIGQEKAIISPYIVNSSTDIPVFKDLKGHWCEEFIRALISMNLTDGFSDGTYQPDKPMTRAQYAALVTAAFTPAPKRPAPEFTDVAQDFWAASAIKTAASGGFVSGFSDRTFRPQQNVQRLQVIVSLVNGLGLSAAAQEALLVYSDQNTIPEYARTAIATATQQKIIVNYPDIKQLAPTREATRAEVAAMVYQALVAIQRAKPINSPYVVVLHITN